jgi:hypothetical protein
MIVSASSTCSGRRNEVRTGVIVNVDTSEPMSASA